jgi:hypothetical protein
MMDVRLRFDDVRQTLISTFSGKFIFKLVVEFANALIDSGAFQEACRGGHRTEKATTVNSASVFAHKVRIAATAQKESS